MTIKEYTCVVCPNGCTILADVDDGAVVVTRVQGNDCKRGADWVRQEVENPMRTVSTSVLVNNGDFLLASVRTNRPVPLVKIQEIMNQIHLISLDAPVSIGDVIISEPAGCNTEIIVTRNVAKSHSN